MADSINLIVTFFVVFSSVVLIEDIAAEFRERVYKIIDSIHRADVPQEHVRFLFYKSGSNNPTILTMENARSLLDPSASTTFIIHGWTHNGTSPWIKTMARLLNEHSAPINVVAVDYGSIANKSYNYAFKSLESVGNITAERIRKLQLPVETIHIIGHSMGALVAAFVGQKIGSRTVGRITGLDPAGPLFRGFYHLAPNFRLSEDDAICVDVIHTMSFARGYDLTVGTIDFFVNGAITQPDCSADFEEAVSCSNQLAHTLYSLTIINGTRYLGVNPFSGKMAYMGHQQCAGSTGSFWVDAPATGEDPQQI